MKIILSVLTLLAALHMEQALVAFARAVIMDSCVKIRTCVIPTRYKF